MSKELSIGAIGSFYRQITDDSGAGALVLGGFRGRDVALDGVLGYKFQLGPIPVSTSVKILREIDVENRFSGTVGWLQVVFPLWVPQAQAAAQTPPLARKF